MRSNPIHTARQLAKRSLAALLPLLVAVGGALAPAGAQAAVPTTTLVQGTLETAGGGPAADGQYSVKFSLYKDALAATPLWSENGSITLKSGQFSYSLGATTPLSPAVLGGATLVAITVGTDPELTRKPLTSKLFAQRAAVAEALACSACISAAQLDAGLQAQVAAVNSLPDVAKSGLWGDMAGQPDFSGYVKKADLKAVATTGSYKDLTGTPVLPKIGSSCGSGLVLAGFKADGSLDCIVGGSAALTGDSIDDLSNNLIFNTFIDKTAGKTDVQIPDGLGAGVTDTLNYPSIGIAQKIWVEMSLTNSDISGIKIELYGPGMLNPYVLYQGGKTGQSLTAKFNDDTPLVSGDMTKDFVGKDITGNWSLTVKDLKAGGGSGGFDGKFNWSVNIQTLSSKKIQIKGDLIVDGAVSAPQVNNAAKKVYYAGWFQTYDNGGGNWYGGNNTEPFGGVNPSNWTDGNGNASNIVDDFDALRSIFNRRRAISPNSIVCAEIWPYTSSTTGRMCGAVFRVKNTTASNINWSLFFYYTSYSGWSEIASVSINGTNVWNSNNNTWPNSGANVGVTVPANKTSTVVVMASSSPGYGNSQRNNFLAFYNSSLNLPAGLEYVDDYETVTGKWKQ